MFLMGLHLDAFFFFPNNHAYGLAEKMNINNQNQCLSR